MRFVKEYMALIALVASIGGPLTAWGATQARLHEVEKKAEVSAEDSKLLAQHKAVIPLIQDDVKDIKQSVKDMAEKQDRQFEQLSQKQDRQFERLMAAVKA